MTKQLQQPKEFTISAGMIKWVVSVVGSLIVLVGGWFVVWDRIDTHWRLEQVQAAKDKEYAAELHRIDNDVKAAKEKAEADTKLLAKKAEVGRAWVVWSIVDTKADISTKLVALCKGLKLSQSECDRWAEDARRAASEAERKKSAAEDSSKEKQ